MPKNQELPGVSGPGVAPLEIPEIDKAISKYIKKKEARCQASPGEIEAKTEVRKLLHAHRDELPVNSEGIPFYRYDDRDYILEEKLKIQKVEGADEDED
jgi:hypothetical protein